MQAIREMEEKGMQNDPRYAQLVAMANRQRALAQGYGHMSSENNLSGPPPYSDSSQSQMGKDNISNIFMYNFVDLSKSHGIINTL